MCEVLGVSRSGYYQWVKDIKSPREVGDERLIDLIRVLHAESKGSYGIRRIVRGLRQQGIVVNVKKIRRLMRQIGLQGSGAAKKRFVVTTDSSHKNPVASNVLKRCFLVDEPNTKWVSDITYIWTEQGWIYVAVILDLYSRMVVGWATSSEINSFLVCSALQRAVTKRKPHPGLILHSDRGVQYSSEEYNKLTKRYGIVASMSRKGNCWDNAVAESFFRSLKVESIRGKTIKTKEEAQRIVFEYIEDFYNSRRIHSFLLYMSPSQWEAQAKTSSSLIARRNLFVRRCP